MTNFPQPAVSAPPAGSGGLLVFCWSNPALLRACLQLTRLVAEPDHLPIVFVTDGALGKLLLLQQGVPAFAVTELSALAKDSPAEESSAADLDRLAELDRRWGWQWFPRKDCPRPDGPDGRGYYRWQAEKVLAAYSLLFESYQPRAVLVWNGAPLYAGALAFLARKKGRPVFFLERGLLPDTLVVDPVGVNYGSHIGGTRWAEAEVPAPTAEESARLADYQEQLRRVGRTIVDRGVNLSPSEVRQKLAIPESARVILFPLQLERDSNLLNYSPHYRTMPEIIRRLQEALRGMAEVVLVVKPHPEDRDRLPELGALCGPRTRLSEDLSLPAVLEAADLIVTVNSTAGLEGLIRRKPVVVLGQAIYGEKGFTADLKNPEALVETLNAAIQASQDHAFPEAEFHRFLLYLLKSCLFPLEDTDLAQAWHSRENIARKVLSALAPEQKAVDPSPDLRPVLELNQKIRGIFPSPLDAANPTSSVLLLGPPEGIPEFLAEALPGSQIAVWRRANLWMGLFHFPGRKWDYVLNFDRGVKRALAAWSLARARVKLQII